MKLVIGDFEAEVYDSEFGRANFKLRNEIVNRLMIGIEEKIGWDTDTLISTSWDTENEIHYYEQSPIESLFILNLYALLKLPTIGNEPFATTLKYGFVVREVKAKRIFSAKVIICDHTEQQEVDNDLKTLVVWPQYAIRCGKKKYRVDFLFKIHSGDIVIFPPEGGERTVVPVVQLCVEFDGHDYHERTKEQARYDKQRDRDIKLAGYGIIHFTGSEVYKDWMSVFDQILDAMLLKA